MSISAYGSITITDLLDTATYIYYSTSSGTATPAAWHIAAAPSDEYIGIYSGAPAESGQPNPPTTAILSSMQISKFVGAAGPTGPAGPSGINTATVQIYKRSEQAISTAPPSSLYTFSTGTITNLPDNWSIAIPTANGNPCYVTSAVAISSAATATLNWSIPVKFVEDGAERVLVYSSKEKILKFYTSASTAPAFSPETIQFWAIATDSSTRLEPGTDYKYDVDFDACPSVISTLGSMKVKQGTSTSSVTFSSVFVSPNTTNNYVQLNVAAITNCTYVSGTSAQSSAFTALKSAILDNNSYMNFKIYKDSISQEKLINQKPIFIEFGTSQDMAKFALTANKIQGMVDDTILTLDANGLHLTDGNFSIGKMVNGSEVKLLDYDINTQRLVVSGDIHADTFTGNSGCIGSWIIRQDGLYSLDGSTGSGTNYDSYNVTNANIKLLGAQGSGTIVANNITLGTGAEIADYIAVGTASWLNPAVHSGLILKAGKAELSEDGIFHLGLLTLDGKDDALRGQNWRIEPDLADFKNINVSGKITSAVFEVDNNTAVGGSMIFKPAYKVISYTVSDSTTTVIIENNHTNIGGVGDGIEAGDYVYLVNSDGALSQLVSVATASGDNLTFTTDPFNGTIGDQVEVTGIIKIGNLADNHKELIISINSTEARTDLAYPQGLTISEVGLDNNSLTHDLRVFVGNLERIGKSNLTGYGLYGENVYLQGSITTKTSEDIAKYAGINTISQVSADKFGDTDTSKIVFWAGALANSASEIRNAKFQVTEEGSVYASQARFTNSIIADSTIEATEIRTARIYGTGNDPGLMFYDINNAIGFYNANSSDGYDETFTIGNDGFKIRGENFLSINGTQVTSRLNGLQVASDSAKLNIYSDSIYKLSSGSNKGRIKFVDNKISIDFDNTIAIGMDDSIGGNLLRGAVLTGDITKFSVEPQLIKLNTSEVKVEQNMTLGAKLQYKSVTGGYDLYVTGG